jgi:lipopolysaccharide heptosyltransferase III
MLPSPTPRQILVICTRRIGDVLLATPAVRALRQTFADTAVDMLVFEGAQGVVAANPDLRRVITVRERLSIGAHLRLLRRIWRRYDIAVPLLMGDRPILYAWAAGKYRVGTLMIEKFGGWKRQLLQRWVVFDDLDTRTVDMNLKVAEQLGVHQRVRPVVTWREEDAGFAREACQPLRAGKPYAVLHVSPKYAYKTWTAPGGSELGRWLDEHGMQLVIAGGGAAEELRYIDSLLPHFPDNTLNLAGRIGLGALAYVLSRTALYVGTDTAVTHMAAALGVPTVALFGPSNPVKWGPWPDAFEESGSPWQMRGSSRVGNVYLVQGEKHCVPCLREGCDRHVASLSECLQEMPARRVIVAAQALLETETQGKGERCCV